MFITVCVGVYILYIQTDSDRLIKPYKPLQVVNFQLVQVRLCVVIGLNG